MNAELWFAIISLAVGFVGACFSALASIIAYFVKRGEDAQDKQLGQLDTDLKKVREEVASYKAHVGAGDHVIEGIRSDLKDHVTKEEQIFWKKVEAISEAQRISNETVLQRVTAIESRMPNGELNELTKAVARIEIALESVKAEASKASQHVIDHDREAEEWKRRIVGLEASSGKSPRARRAP